VALDSGVTKRRIFVAPEGEHGLIHLLGIEHLQPHQQMKVLDRMSPTALLEPPMIGLMEPLAGS
jgi:hypothetical protein